MSADNFYLTLPSNTGQNWSASTFRIRLPRNIKLTGEWEVALSELIYPYSFFNVLWSPELFIDVVTYDEKSTSVEIKPGHYEHAQDLIAAISKRLPEKLIGQVSFNYDKHGNRIEIVLSKQVTYLSLPSSISYMLGYKTSYGFQTLITRENGLAPYPPDMHGGSNIFFVYCDVVENSVVGDKLVPVLRAVALEGKFGDIIDKNFICPHYVPVLKKEFDSIEIDIKNDQNKPLPFNFGKTMVKLHFRRKRISLFE